jgi:hypothetical protein
MLAPIGADPLHTGNPNDQKFATWQECLLHPVAGRLGQEDGGATSRPKRSLVPTSPCLKTGSCSSSRRRADRAGSNDS